MRRKKLNVIVGVSRELTAKERKNFKKENPGKRLCFRLRYPNFPLYISLIALLIAVAALLFRILILLGQ